MPDDNSISLVNLGKLSKPADTLIKKVSSAVGGIFEPWQITRVAKAEAKAAIIKTEAAIEVTDLHRRAMHRFVEEEASRQKNMEVITEKALPQLEEGSNPGDMSDDWVTNFFDKSRIVSDEQMQHLWSAILAREANSPGTVSRRTVNLLGDLDKSDAQMFSKLCRFTWTLPDRVPLVFDVQASIYNQAGINFSTLSHLDAIGLIRFDSLAGFRKMGLPKRFPAIYCGKALLLEFQQEHNNDLGVGNVLFTRAGLDLAAVCGTEPISGLMEYVAENWKAHLPAA